MTSALLALGVGTVLAIGALAYVLYPIFFASTEKGRTDIGGGNAPGLAVSHRRMVGVAELAENVAVVALREIEFDRATGKLSDDDYGQLKERYTREALAGMRREPSLAPAVGGDAVEDEIEAAIRAYRAQHPACPACGPRPELDAVFCSSCGRYLPGTCERCGTRIEELGARFCVACGHRLAA